MSITLTITAIAASLIAGTAIGIREQRKRGIRPELSDDIDDCITVYADEERCDCEGEKVSAFLKNGKPHCADCGRRIY